MRYINLASLIHSIGARVDCKDCTQSQTDCMAQTLSRMDICNLVEDTPYLDIVTCGECMYFDDRPGWTSCQAFGKWFGEKEMSANDYCSLGEKR